MRNAINKNNYERFAHVPHCKRPGRLKGLVVHFYNTEPKPSDFSRDELYEDKFFAHYDMLRIVPYYNPLALMTQNIIDFVNEIIDTVIADYSLPSNIPIALIGEGMGGQAAMMFAIKSGRELCSCGLNTPISDLVDLVNHYPAFWHVAYQALHHESQYKTLKDAMRAYSPALLIPKIPRLRYHVVWTRNMYLNPFPHYARLVQGMRSKIMPVSFAAYDSKIFGKLDAEQYRLLLKTMVEAVHKEAKYLAKKKAAEEAGVEYVPDWPPPKRKRGRPPKEKTVAESEAMPKRKRGRPPKVKPETDAAAVDTASNAKPDTAPTADAPQKRKRGRPPKAKPTEEAPT